MKTFFVLFFLGLSSSNAFAFELESFCRKDLLRNTCLRTFLQLKCSYYSGKSFAIRRDFACEKTVEHFVKILDLGETPKETGEKFGEEVAFKTDLTSLVRDPKTKFYLSKLRDLLEKSQANLEPFRLWDETLKLSESDRNLALKRIAVLFQDAATNPDGTESSSSHIRYLKNHLIYKTHSDVIDLLDEVGSYFSVYALGLMPQIKVYPAGFDPYLNPTFYHFYIILYLSEKLRLKGNSLEMSFFVPFLFNTQYEFRGLPGWPLRDPEGNYAGTDWKSKEIYAGYLASFFGSKVGKKPIDYETFKKSLQSSPYYLIRSLFFIRTDPDKLLSYKPNE